MRKEQPAEKSGSARSRLFSKEGRPLRVLSTSLGIALLAHAALAPGLVAADNAATTDEPRLVAWSNEDVKKYFDARTDWSLPALETLIECEEPGSEDDATACDDEGDGTNQTNNVRYMNSGFGWDDLLLYHLLFNRGSSYSSSSWYKKHKTYYPGTKNVYTPPTYSNKLFTNKPVAGSVVKSTSSSTKSSSTTRSTSSSSGSIGGKSSGFSSSGSSSSSSSSSSFGG